MGGFLGDAVGQRGKRVNMPRGLFDVIKRKLGQVRLPRPPSGVFGLSQWNCAILVVHL